MTDPPASVAIQSQEEDVSRPFLDGPKVHRYMYLMSPPCEKKKSLEVRYPTPILARLLVSLLNTEASTVMNENESVGHLRFPSLAGVGNQNVGTC